MRTKTDDNVRATYQVREAANVAGSGEAFIRDGISKNLIPHIRHGRKILIPRSAFHRWLDTCGKDGATA